MKNNLLILLVISLVTLSCTMHKGAIPHNPTQTGQVFISVNSNGEKLFDVIAPVGQWISYDWTKENVAHPELNFYYKGQNSGMINAEIRIMYLESTFPRTSEEVKNRTTIAELNKSMAHLLDKNNRNNLQDFYKPKNLEHGIRNIAGINCRYFSITNHSGPALDTPTTKFRGLGSAKKQEEYLCPVIRDGKPWFLGVHIVYNYSDLIHKQGLDIDFYDMIKDFDRMLKPTLESLKLYGELKQY